MVLEHHLSLTTCPQADGVDVTTPPWPTVEPDGPRPAPPPNGQPQRESQHAQQQAPYPQAQHQQGQYQGGYEQGPYQQGSYQQGQYQQAPYPWGPYQGQHSHGPYQGQYSQGPYPGQYPQGPYQSQYPQGPYPGQYSPYPYVGPPSPPAGKPPAHRWGFGAFLLAEAAFLLMSLLVPMVAIIPYVVRDPGAARDGAPLPGPVLIAALAIPPLVAAVVALIATKVRGNGPVVDLRLRFGWRDVGIGVGCGFVGLFLTIPVGWLWVYLVGEDNANSAVGEVFDGMHMPVVLAVLVFLDVWLLAPICEEILYRGLLWGAMDRREWNRWLILGVTTVVFAVAHFEPIRAPLLLVIGLPIGLARLLSGRLAASVIAHQINNFLPALGLMLLLLGHPMAA